MEQARRTVPGFHRSTLGPKSRQSTLPLVRDQDPEEKSSSKTAVVSDGPGATTGRKKRMVVEVEIPPLRNVNKGEQERPRQSTGEATHWTTV